MNIEVLGAGMNNKGAHLMLTAIVTQMRLSFPQARLAVRSKKGKDWVPGELDLYQKPALSESSPGNLLTRLKFGKNARQRYHMILDPEIDVILDASGFKYSDQFGHLGTFRRAKRIAGWKRAGKKIVLLPQAFGPLEVPKVREAIKIIADNADLMFPRDRDSYDYVNRVVGDRENIKIYPDFTNKVDGIVPEYFAAVKPRACLVPNSQMIAKTPDAVGESYIPFFARCAQYLEKAKLDPFILLHDLPKDKPLADEIRRVSRVPLEIIEDENPLHLKGILGKCHIVVGSRYHALISALSQGVPAVATGWSHKYEQLYGDYGCKELLVANLDFEAEAFDKLQMLADSRNRERVIRTIRESAGVEIQKTERMWKEVIDVISG